MWYGSKSGVNWCKWCKLKEQMTKVIAKMNPRNYITQKSLQKLKYGEVFKVWNEVIGLKYLFTG